MNNTIAKIHNQRTIDFTRTFNIVSFHPTVELYLCTEFDEEINAIFTCSKSVHTVDASTFCCLNANAI